MVVEIMVSWVSWAADKQILLQKFLIQFIQFGRLIYICVILLPHRLADHTGGLLKEQAGGKEVKERGWWRV
jgi:hypothetical protein